MDNLLVTVIGNPNSGKTHTWHRLFDRKVNTGKRERWLLLSTKEKVKVFLISGSPKERKKSIADLITGTPRIALCSLQYDESEFESLDWFDTRGYSIMAQWLNPGYCDGGVQEDTLNFSARIIRSQEVFSIRNGKEDARQRVNELHQHIREWASARGLIVPI